MLFYSLIYCLLLPVFIIRTLFKDKDSLKQKLGFGYNQHKDCIHFHCVSVGEFNASIPLINKLLIDNQIVITTTTKTGKNACKKYYNNKITHYYFPFDLSLISNKFIKIIQPKLSIILETEIWPNFINSCCKNQIKILLINARLSKESFKKYYQVKGFINKVINKFNYIAVQDELSQTNFKKLGIKNSQIISNLKFDINPIIDVKKLAIIKDIIVNRKIIVCASTHHNEEEEIIKAYQKNPCPQLLVIIPRHPQRFLAVENILKNYKINYKKQNDGKFCDKNTQILLADSMGFVLEFYTLCDLAFIGGSLTPTGGHNMLESIAFNKLTIFGKHIFNFKNIGEELIKKQGSIMINTAEELFKIIQDFTKNTCKYQNIQKNGIKFLKNNAGASDKLATIIKNYIN